MKKRVAIFIIILGLVCTCFYYAGFTSSKEEGSLPVYQELDLFGEVMAIINDKYVEEKPFKDLVYGALSGLASSLDSYSQFLKPEDYKELLVETEGKFGGLGIEITLKDGLLTVVSPIEGTPAFNAGIKPGDIIVKIDGEITQGITLHGAVKKMRGEPGTSVTLTVLRERERILEDVTIVRDIIMIKDIRRALIIEDGIGYIRLAEFRENTTKDLDKALQKMEGEGMKALILDLRNNPGGLLISAIEVASRFLLNDKVIVSTKSREGDAMIYKSLTAPRKYLDVPMVILINKGSASGSEIVAAALRENDRAVLLGDTTFGKASVQSVIPLKDGSALRLTTAKYYTPSGKSIHKDGVSPDITVSREISPDPEEKKEDIFQELEEKPKEEFDYSKDYQLLRTVDLIKGLMVLDKQ